MMLRTARKGRNAGGQFWGCSDYPNCKGIVPYEPSTTDEARMPEVRRRKVPWFDGTQATRAEGMFDFSPSQGP